MTNYEEIRVLESLRGDTRFAEAFGNDVEKMIENLKNGNRLMEGTATENIKNELSSKVKETEEQVHELERQMREKVYRLNQESNETLRTTVLEIMERGDYDIYDYLESEFDELFALRCKYKKEGELDEESIERLFELAEG